METENNTDIAGNSPEDCFWELDLYTESFFWSPGFCKLLGINVIDTPTFEQLIGFYPPEKNVRSAFKRAIHQGVAFDLEFDVLTEDQKPFIVNTIGAPIYDDYGKCIAVKGFFDGTTKENKSEDAVFMPENSEERQKVLKNFAWLISHNLRSHTINLQMAIESMEQNMQPKEMLELFGTIKNISKNLDQTVGYLNTLVRI